MNRNSFKIEKGHSDNSDPEMRKDKLVSFPITAYFT